jgi:predicted RNA-binding Zn ribbon-like protein
MESAGLTETVVRFVRASKELADASTDLRDAIERHVRAQTGYQDAYRALSPDELDQLHAIPPL